MTSSTRVIAWVTPEGLRHQGLKWSRVQPFFIVDLFYMNIVDRED